MLAAYARFYSLLLQSRADSWEQYLMDQVWEMSHFKCVEREAWPRWEGESNVVPGVCLLPMVACTCCLMFIGVD